MFQFLLLLMSIADGTSFGQDQGGPVCPSCSDSTTAKCYSLVRCEADEQCYTQKYVTQTGEYRFTSGCEKKSVCAALSKRDVSEPVVCESCCNPIGCISSRCGSRSMYAEGVACYSCSGVSDPKQCKTARYCTDRYQKCLTYEYRVPLTNQVKYYMGCATRKTCEALDRVGAQIHVSRNEKWYNQTCCHKDFCNQFGSTDHLSLPSTKSTLDILG